MKSQLDSTKTSIFFKSRQELSLIYLDWDIQEHTVLETENSNEMKVCVSYKLTEGHFLYTVAKSTQNMMPYGGSFSVYST
jgi:hypothetical protein